MLRKFKVYNVTMGPNGEPKGVLAGEAVESRDGRIDLYLNTLGLQAHLAALPERQLAAKPMPPAPAVRPERVASRPVITSRIATPGEQPIRMAAKVQAAQAAATRGTGIEHNHAPGLTNVPGCSKCHCDRIVAEELER
jgi:hypothetical protein